MSSPPGLLFFVNLHPTRPSIDRSRIDGADRRKVIEHPSVEMPVDVAIDVEDERVIWADSGLRRVESADLNGADRRVLAENAAPVAVAVHGNDVLWLDGDRNAVLRVDKRAASTTPKAKVTEIKAHVKHLSSLISITPLKENPCLKAGCSHLCVIDDANDAENTWKCLCPRGSNIVLNADGRTCGLPPTCKPDEFTCLKGSPPCIPLQWRCDGQSECLDHSDELDCPECESKQFRCRDGQCVNSTLLCNGVKDCRDNSDELSCCPKDEFRCAVSGECIDYAKTCDGFNDCRDNSDEVLALCGVSAIKANDLDEGQDAGEHVNSNAIALSVVAILILLLAVGIILWIYRRNAAKKLLERQRKKPFQLPLEAQQQQQQHHPQQTHRHSVPDLDRPSHVTGASSSSVTTGSMPQPVPPVPSPSTTVRYNTRRQQRHQSGGYGYRANSYRSQQPRSFNPPTPCSTDINDESDYGKFTVISTQAKNIGYFFIGGVGRPHFPSAANSTYEDGENDVEVDDDEEEVDEECLGPPPAPINECSYFLNGVNNSNGLDDRPQAPYPSPAPSLADDEDS